MIAAGLGWNSYYYVLLGWAACNTLSLAITYHPNFMKPKPEDEETELPSPSETAKSSPTIPDSPPLIPVKLRGPLHIVVTNRFCWLVALYLVLYLGLEISTGGWVVSFMIQVPSSHSPNDYRLQTGP
jgi:hypothetical protein